jgi:hypothetical protein
MEIVKDNATFRKLKTDAAIAKKVTSELLGKKGLNDPDYFILRLKESSKLKDWIALYRTNSVLSGRPIFWINAKLPEIARREGADIKLTRIIVDNILHEWWHAICDALRASQQRNVPLKTKISFQPDNNEEDLAEKFISYCGGDAWNVISDEEMKMFVGAIQEAWNARL